MVSSAAACAVVRENLASLGLSEASEVVQADAATAVHRLARAGRRFELALLDPPYAAPEALERALRAVATSGILAPDAMVVAETSRRLPLPAIPGLASLDERRYGDTVVHRLVHRLGREMHAAMSDRARSSDPRLALFAASFDPVTNGHLDLVQRARPLFSELVVAVARNVAKQGTFRFDERVEMLRAVLGQEPGIRIAVFDGLLVDYARQIGARVLLRGLRAVSDFEYEFEMALMNRRLCPEIETLFMMTSQQFFYVSSSRLKELVRFGADVSDFVPALVAERLKEKLGGTS